MPRAQQSLKRRNRRCKHIAIGWPVAAQVLKFSDAPPVHRPLTGKGWRDFPTPLLASTDDKKSAIIAIFIDLVTFGVFRADLALIFGLLQVARAGSGHRTWPHVFVLNSLLNAHLRYRQNNLLPARPLLFPRQTPKLAR
ncbi:hypothetical protein E5S69_19990 [Cupriavidus necator]|uniref:hypothetical protein n=1 Tax=Cupriavidus necator TaxID=106590 RepID=UPI0014901099|nr:hypothetical protein [Cupriavidus necator]NOV25786.1 hypothetical protein [Cupriavidus necator]